MYRKKLCKLSEFFLLNETHFKIVRGRRTVTCENACFEKNFLPMDWWYETSEIRHQKKICHLLYIQNLPLLPDSEIRMRQDLQIGLEVLTIP